MTTKQAKPLGGGTEDEQAEVDTATGVCTPQRAQYERETERVLVEIAPRFLASQSFPLRSRFVWSYAVRITNRRDEPIRLLRRYWRLTDSAGRTDEVHGDGVVGQKPIITPGETFEYSSRAPLRAASGLMAGHFEMVDHAGEEFVIKTPVFSLDSPFEKPTFN